MAEGKKVMVVEDDCDISNLIAYTLQKEGFRAEQYFDGESALRRIKEDVFDIFILDIMLPGPDGFEICKAIKDDPRFSRAFIIMVSAKCREQDRLYAHLLGADYYLTKPFNLASLTGAVREASSFRDREYLVKAGK
ncbi:MAG: response regulator [Candidatus Omnitrophica bacterium]|jgi:DNA-binding response OmpR family regulator|nr:response regulator [Candidatus Omnitrophota bacterium]MDD3274518.1 response regulator [Candidatus Omnitrophota bacterium]MDD5077587.1 response regulator [Candidatus Omnitrophota bacterium]MDD5724849.1 response regulator [Candidatus Omnitrophota bacterium]